MTLHKCTPHILISFQLPPAYNQKCDCIINNTLNGRTSAMMTAFTKTRIQIFPHENASTHSTITYCVLQVMQLKCQMPPCMLHYVIKEEQNSV